jgi:hypothetical protein
MSPRRAPLGHKCGNRRPPNILPLRQSFLIVCGGRTEQNYFEAFSGAERMTTVRIRTHLIGRNPTEVVEAARQRQQRAQRLAEPFDQVWCVFDRDEFPGPDFNHAIALARQYGMDVAYSNEAFELWYVLHFGYTSTPMDRREYCRRLDKLLGHAYDKASATMHRELESRLPDALEHAKRLLAQYDPPNPMQDRPSTRVHVLVEQLLSFALPPGR